MNGDESNFRTVEINGVKLEIDLREAKRIDGYKIGSPVRVLVKEYENNYKTCTGVIVGFDDFKSLPTITVAYITNEYGTSPLKYASINAKTTGIEIAPADAESVAINKAEVLDLLDRDITQKEEAARDAKNRKALFLKHFNKFIALQEEAK